jgi:hypothetical protein
MHPGTIGAITGTLFGVLGGAVGTYFSVKNTRGPKERAFVVKCVVLLWTAGAGFVAALILLPKPFGWLLWVPYAILLPLGIRKWNRRQEEIRREEARESA